MILTDIIELNKNLTWKKTDDNKSKVEDVEKLNEAIKASKILNKFTTYNERDAQVAISKVTDRIKKLFDEKCMEMLLENSTLPPTLIDRIKESSTERENSNLLKLIDTPKVNLSHLRDIADKLGFIMIPFNYLSKASYANESWDTKRSILHFNEAVSELMHVYVLCPIKFYDLKSHVSSDEDLSIYTGPEASQAFLALNMTIPMFRSLSKETERLRKHSEKMDQEIENLIKRVNSLEIQVEKQRQAALIKDQQNEKLREELRSLQKSNSFFADDPLMFAFDSKKEITDDGIAYIGPCWGKDFNDIVFASVGLTKVKDQRALLSRKASQWI